VVPPAPGYIQLGVSIELLAELAAKEGSRLGGQQKAGLAVVRQHQALRTCAVLSFSTARVVLCRERCLWQGF
jgi:hypothetical protein